MCALVVLLFGSLLCLCMGLCDQVSPEVKLFSWVVWGSSENGWVHTSTVWVWTLWRFGLFLWVGDIELPTHTLTPRHVVGTRSIGAVHVRREHEPHWVGFHVRHEHEPHGFRRGTDSLPWGGQKWCAMGCTDITTSG